MTRREPGGRAADASSSLDLLTHTAEQPRRLVECPRSRGGRLIQAPWGEIIAAPCRAVRCPACGPSIKVWEAISTLVWQLRQVEHARYAVLTMPHAEWTPDRVRREVAEFIRRLRAMGYRIEAGYVVALNPAGTGYHVDLYSYGDYIDQKVWQSANRNEIVNVQEIKAKRDRAIGYAFKETLGYAFKETGEQLGRHLELNGGKLYRTTRGFYGTLTRREAEAAARADKRAGRAEPGWKVLYGRSDRLVAKGEGKHLTAIAAAAAAQRAST